MIKSADHIDELFYLAIWVVHLLLLVDANGKILATIFHVLHSIYSSSLVDTETAGTGLWCQALKASCQYEPIIRYVECLEVSRNF